jgi:hypothetical protein
MIILNNNKKLDNLSVCQFLSHLRDLFDVHLLILPSHCTHVIQTFDLSVASPLKVSFSAFMDDTWFPALEELMQGTPFISSRDKMNKRISPRETIWT